MATELRSELEKAPARIAKLPVHRGYPVPWFVEWIEDGESRPIGTGQPDFRVMSHERLSRAMRESRCWVCGEKMGRYRAFVIGPMCAVNRTSAEPPSHVECGEWSARNCPFLARPHARRREAGLPGETMEAAGIALMRNPGVALVWVTMSRKVWKEGYRPYNAPGGGILFDIGAPQRVSWWAHGRTATREEILASIDSGLPALAELAREEGPEAMAELAMCVTRAKELLPA